MSTNSTHFLALLCTISAFLGWSIPSLADQIYNEVGKDVQTLQAWRTENYYTGEDLKVCRIVSSSSGYDHNGDPIRYDLRDCTSPFEAILKTPAVHAVMISTYTDGQGNMSAPFFRCAPTEIRVVTKIDAMESPIFRGIGFYHNETGKLQLTATASLLDYGEVTLKDGARARVHGFFSFTKCWRGSASSSIYHKEEFKPYAEYSVYNGDVQVYRKWENVESNLALGQLFGYDWENRIESFDRQFELLRQ